jgi:hypothetical protein
LLYEAGKRELSSCILSLCGPAGHTLGMLLKFFVLVFLLQFPSILFSSYKADRRLQ